MLPSAIIIKMSQPEETPVYRAYIDGSFKDGRCNWGLILLDEHEQVLEQRTGSLSGPILSMRQVGGELKAALEAVRHARRRGARVEIYYDYLGIYQWVADIFGGAPWKRNNEWTQKYAEYMKRHKDTVVRFVKVKAHSGDRWNTAVDRLVAAA